MGMMSGKLGILKKILTSLPRQSKPSLITTVWSQDSPSQLKNYSLQNPRLVLFSFQNLKFLTLFDFDSHIVLISSFICFADMARNYVRFLALILAISICCEAAIFRPISESHRSAALDLFKPIDGSFSSLEETYEALRTFEVLGIGNKLDISASTCPSVVEVLGSSSSNLKTLFYALRNQRILKCALKEEILKGVSSKLKAAVNSASALPDFYHSIGGLVLIKDQTPEANVLLDDAEGVFRSIKALSQSDGRWRYGSNNPESSTYAAGMAFEALAGVISLAPSEIEQAVVATVKNDVVKLFDSIEKYDDGSLYFDEKIVNGHEHQGPIFVTSSVIRGVTAFAAVASGSLKLPGDDMLGLAKFFLGIGIPGNTKDLFNQGFHAIDSIPSSNCPFIDSERPAQGVSVSSVLGYNTPPLTVTLVQASSSSSKSASIIENQELKFDHDSSFHVLDALPKSVDIGKYLFTFEVVLNDSENEKVYATGGKTQVPIFITGVVKIDSPEIAILDSDLGSIETQKKLDLAGENSVTLSANHLQKLRLSFQLSTPSGKAFKPHQAIIKLRHESNVEHVFLVGNSGKQFEIILDFLGLVEKFYYLSGGYDIQLTVGDAVMENSLLKALGHIELDLPEPPEKAARPPAQPVDPYSRYGPKAEISHIFRTPEKRPPQELSLGFLGLILVPFIGFLVGLLTLGVNLKNFPSSAVPAIFAALFHLGIGAVLLLYVLFWLKLDLFMTLKALGLLGIFLIFVGQRILSHLASTSAKLKSGDLMTDFDPAG
ncbi:Dolichyl-diphosphooligosaccharide--protein glycosyltransferase subunit Swp1, partial [Dillenia turbinata]